MVNAAVHQTAASSLNNGGGVGQTTRQEPSVHRPASPVIRKKLPPSSKGKRTSAGNGPSTTYNKANAVRSATGAVSQARPPPHLKSISTGSRTERTAVLQYLFRSSRLMARTTRPVSDRPNHVSQHNLQRAQLSRFRRRSAASSRISKT